ncbi:MAG: AAA family ATPase [Anaerolineae bacterium]
MNEEPAYLPFFGLKEEPFTASPNPRFLYASPLHHLALQKTRYVVSAKKGLCVVFGDTGTGKTTLSRLLYQQFVDDKFITALITNPSYPTPFQLLRTIMQEFEFPKYGRSFKASLDRLKEFLYQQAIQEQKTLVLIVDEAQTLHVSMLEFLRQLLNYETNEQKLLQLVLFGQNELRSKLRRSKNFYNRIALKASLENLSLSDSRDMLEFRWKVAGGKKFPFTPDGLEAVYEYSSGVPRTQVILADNCLLVAFLNQEKEIGRNLVAKVAQDQEIELAASL